VENILRTIYNSFRGDPKRSYLTGFSYGAKVSLILLKILREKSRGLPYGQLTTLTTNPDVLAL